MPFITFCCGVTKFDVVSHDGERLFLGFNPKGGGPTGPRESEFTYGFSLAKCLVIPNSRQTRRASFYQCMV